MKVIISRKGFDSSFGGVASPILPNGSMMSLPIPGNSRTKYKDIYSSIGDMNDLLSQLTKGKITGETRVHFDPDINPTNLNRKEGWLGSLGQTGSAQGHLEAQNIQKGDIFLFFGWFRDVIYEDGKYFFKPKSPDLHVLFGYLQIGEILKLGSNPDKDKILEIYPWLEGHPHLYGEREKNNCLYIASENLVLNGETTNLPGAYSFDKFDKSLCLTAPNQSSRSLWKVPGWLKSPSENNLLTYHGDSKRWFKDEEGNTLLQSVAKGQEFVTELKDEEEFAIWFNSLITKPNKRNKIKF